MSARLEILEEERSVDLDEEGEIVLGRETDCGVVLANPAVSRYHVKMFSFCGIEWLVEDLGSRHGTLLNGAPLKENHAVSLRDRDRLEIAGTQVIFHAEKPDLATEERTAFLAQQVVADMLGSLSGQEEPLPAVLDGPEEGQRVMLDGQKPYLIFGRSPDCDVLLDESNVSRRHARVTVDFSGIWIEDLGSKNGIQVAGEVVRDKVRLKDRTEVQVGGVRMMFCDPASAYLGDLDKSGDVPE